MMVVSVCSVNPRARAFVFLGASARLLYLVLWGGGGGVQGLLLISSGILGFLRLHSRWPALSPKEQ